MPSVFIETNADEIARYFGGLRKDLRPKAMKDAAKEIEREVLRRYRRTVATWHHKPSFETIVEISGSGVNLLVGTDDKIYAYVDLGTPPHYIFPINARMLRFQAGYRAKTAPGVLQSGAGGPYGPYVYRREVLHPGTEARRFSEVIMQEMEPLVSEICYKHINDWLNKRYV